MNEVFRFLMIKILIISKKYKLIIKKDKGTQFNGNKNHKNFRNKMYTSFPHIKEEMNEKIIQSMAKIKICI